MVSEKGASLSASACRISNNPTTGIRALGSGTSVTVNAVWISGTPLSEEVKFANGIEAIGGANLSVTGSLISDNHTTGVLAAESGTVVTASEVWVSGMTLNAEGLGGYGITAAGGASLSVSGSAVSDNHTAGIAVWHSDTTATVGEVWISGTQMNGKGQHGRGVYADEGATLSVSRSLVSDNHTAGIQANGDDTILMVSEVWVSGTRVNGEGLAGIGIGASSNASFSVSGSRLSDNHTAAVSFIQSGGSVTDSVLEGTKISGLQLGDGLLATGSVVTVDRVISRDNARAGVLFDRSDGELSGSLITQNAIGLANQGQPGAAISEDNVIEGNDQDRLDDGDLEVPDEAMSIPDLPAFD
ncbi:MAG: hypothetical protein CL940_05555 [Deltaproteobacteria bacterium]|nr:hypothetical protein [Deltaproteobacteria bacterium]